MVRGMSRLTSRQRWLITGAAGPSVVLAALEAVVLLIAAVADHPRWPDTRLTLSEAAAVRDHAEVVRILEGGGIANARFPVRPGLLGNEAVIQATPLEAAISIRRAELVELLFEHGAGPSSADWLRLRCAAAALQYDEIVAMLDARKPGDVDIRCVGDESLW
jgi:hypothetical protein